MFALAIYLSVAFVFFLRQEDFNIPGIAMALLSTLAVGFLVLSYAITRHFTLYYEKGRGNVFVALFVGFCSLLAPRFYNFGFLIRDHRALSLVLIAGIFFAFSRASIVEAIRTRINFEGSDAMKMVRNFPPRSSDDIFTLRLLACAMYLLPLLAELHWSIWSPNSHP